MLGAMELPPAGHDPALLRETLDLLSLRPGMSVVDCTLGRGGHALAIAQRIAPDGLLLALDADPRNLEFARKRLEGAPSRVRFFQANFAELADVIEAAGVGRADAILADLGFSTNQLFEEQYGMSFAQPMPLDMRIDPRTRKTAADLVNQLSENDLANVLYELAQERYSRRIARKIVEARHFSPITTTERLAELVRSAVPRVREPHRGRGGAPSKIDPATKTFLALRMAVNQEVENLAALLEQAPRFLAGPQAGRGINGGRMAVISFQSTEDRVVKQAFRSAEQAGVLKVLTKKPVIPSEPELAANPRSRSAKMRISEKT
jgi:16S rRNA (cytosine1402-N4)-methyltransferase